MKKIILWWGRFDNNYSRNRILRNLMVKLGYQIVDFKPFISKFGSFQAKFSINVKPSLLWVPCFRHRDLKSALKWACKEKIPLIFDPLISSWDKKINEQKKFIKSSKESIKIKKNESYLFDKSDFLIADTEAHKNFFIKEFNISEKKIFVINVGAEEKFFFPNEKIIPSSKEILFYGSFLELHGVDVIIDAAKLLINKPIKWTLIGNFNKRDFKDCPSNISLEPSIGIEELAYRIRKASILLGIFSDSDKANNVIPNKVFQSLACGKPVITRLADAYPKFLTNGDMGIYFIEPNNPKALANLIVKLISDEKQIEKTGKLARKTFQTFFSEDQIMKQLQDSLEKVFIGI